MRIKNEYRMSNVCKFKEKQGHQPQDSGQYTQTFIFRFSFPLKVPLITPETQRLQLCVPSGLVLKSLRSIHTMY
jgi:hypothetical protein